MIEDKSHGGGGQRGKEAERESPYTILLTVVLSPQLKFTADFTARLTFLHVVNHLQALGCSK